MFASPAGYLSEILKICGLLTGMEVKCVSHMFKESLYCGFRPCHSVFIGEDTFSGRESSLVIISHSNTGGAVVGRRGRWSRPATRGRLGRPQVSCEHPILLEDTNLTPRIQSFFFFSYTKVGLFISFMEH